MNPTTISPDKKGRRAALYARVSTGRQEEERTIQAQIREIEQYAQQHGMSIVKRYLDEGWSGTALERPALDELRTQASSGEWSAVVIYDPDRLARKYYFQELVMNELKEEEVDVLFVTMPEIKNDEDQLMFGVRGVFAQYERYRITERFRIGKLRKAHDGKVIASEAPYGYDLITRRGKRGDDSFEDTHYVINEDEAIIVRRIFEWVGNEGMTIRKVVARLKEDGILPRKSKRGVWNTSTLGTLLRNRTYIGEGHYGASYAVKPKKPLKEVKYKQIMKSSRKMRPRHEWINIPVPAIFDTAQDKALFERTQEQLKRNAALAQRNRKNEYLLAGLIRCTCGRSRAGEGPQKGKYRYYRCTSRVHDYPLPASCPQRGVNAHVADALVWEHVAKIMTSPDLMRQHLDEWLLERSTPSAITQMDVQQRQEAEIEKIKKQEERLGIAYSEGVLSLEQFSKLTTPLKQRRDDLESQRSVSDADHDTEQGSIQLPDPEELKAFVEACSRYFESLNFEQKRDIISNTVTSIVAEQTPEKGSMAVFGSIPLNYRYEFKTEYRHRRAPQCGEVDTLFCTHQEERPHRELPVCHHRPGSRRRGGAR
jgi:site-specific DNA recombinase